MGNTIGVLLCQTTQIRSCPFIADTPPRSVEGLGLLATLPPGIADRLRLILLGDYLVLYVVDDRKRTVTLLSIRHHRQVSFDFARMWGGE